MIICTYYTECNGHELHAIKDDETGVSITFQNHKVSKVRGAEGLSGDVVQNSVLEISAAMVTSHTQLVADYCERQAELMREFKSGGIVI